MNYTRIRKIDFLFHLPEALLGSLSNTARTSNKRPFDSTHTDQTRVRTENYGFVREAPFFFVMRRSVKVGKNVYVCDIYSTNDGGLLWTTVSFTSLLDEQNACRVSSRTTSRNLLNAALIVDAGPQRVAT